jgi:hypothetical protein
MHIYHTETNQQHGIPLHILQRWPVPTQTAGLYEIPCSRDKIYIRQTSCHISTMTSLHIIYTRLKSQSSVVFHNLCRQNAARTSSEQKSPIHRPTNHVPSRKPQRYEKTPSKYQTGGWIETTYSLAPPLLPPPQNPDTSYPIL